MKFFPFFNPRYAITNVEVKVTNNDGKTQQAHFEMFIPKDAFVSNYTMIIKDEVYIAKVETKEEANDIYMDSTNNAGLVQENNYKTDSKDMKKACIFSFLFFLKLCT